MKVHKLLAKCLKIMIRIAHIDNTRLTSHKINEKKKKKKLLLKRFNVKLWQYTNHTVTYHNNKKTNTQKVIMFL